MSNTLRITAFCNLFQEFLTDLSQSFPNEGNLKFVLNSMKMMRSLGQDKVIVEQFMTNVGPYADKIIAKDESFFLQSEFDTDDSYIADEIQRIKGIWMNPNTSQDTKECIHKYFVSLLKIGENCQF